jgi:5'(3')-deoxyribonucleotidase
MKNNLQEEIDAMKSKKDKISSDLEKFAVELSAASQVTLIARIVTLDALIKDKHDELAEIKWQEIVSDYHKNIKENND